MTKEVKPQINLKGPEVALLTTRLHDQVAGQARQFMKGVEIKGKFHGCTIEP